MKRLLIAAAVVAVVAIVVGVAIAATSGGGSDNGSAPSAAAGSSGATVSAKQVGGSGSVLVDSSGKALYANDQEKNGMALCDDACLSFWTPLTAHGTPKGDSLDGKLGVVSRPDGTKQVTFDGKLLYTFYLDEPGKVSGDGFTDAFAGRQFTWDVVHANGSTSSGGTDQPSDTLPGY